MLRSGHVIALCVLALLTIGVVMVNSADMAVHMVGVADEGTEHGISPRSIIFSRATAYMALALAALAAGAFMPVRRLSDTFGRAIADDSSPRAGLRFLGLACAALIVLCALVYVPGLKRHVNGAHRWIQIPGLGGGDALSIQPSEIAKWALIALMAWYGVARARVIHKFWIGLVPALIAIGAVAGFIILADLGTGALIAASACVVLLAAGARLWQFLVFVPVALVGLVAAIISNPYRIDRITAFMNPYADADNTGYHMIQSLISVANGEGYGRGLGHGLQKFGYLLEDRTDFIFAVICEELGIAGAALVIGLYTMLIWACYSVVRREQDRLLRLLTLGVLTTVGLQAVFNLAVVTGLAPTKGIALPMLSYGGTGWILTAFSLGLIAAVDRTQRVAQNLPVHAAPQAPASQPIAA